MVRVYNNGWNDRRPERCKCSLCLRNPFHLLHDIHKRGNRCVPNRGQQNRNCCHQCLKIHLCFIIIKMITIITPINISVSIFSLITAKVSIEGAKQMTVTDWLEVLWLQLSNEQLSKWKSEHNPALQSTQPFINHSTRWSTIIAGKLHI